MKNIAFISLLLLSLPALAQTTSGTVYYEEAIKLEIQLPEGADEAMHAMFPEKQTFGKMLVFNSAESLYKDVEEGEDNNTGTWTGESGGANIQIKMFRPENLTYKNLDADEMVEQKDFLSRKFLIKSELGNLKWKLVKEQKEILGYACQKAELQDTGKVVVAWYSSQIPVSNGPDEYGELPGMILQLDIDNGRRTVTATKVVTDPPKEGLIEAPKKGDKVTQEEYDKIVEEKTKEMQQESGGNVIRIKRG